MNLHYTVYDIQSGEVLRTLAVIDEEHARLQLADGEALVPMKLDHTKHYVIDGRVRTLSPEAQERRANPPSPFHTWNSSRLKWQDLRPASALSAGRRADLVRQIEEIEKRQSRAIREALLDGDKEKLQDIENKIASLREQIAAL